MKQRTLGPFTVSAIGLGAMPLSMNNDKRYPTPDEAEATVHAALDAGVTYIDTADIYAPSWDTMGHNEKIVGAAVRSWSGDASGVVLGTKGGITRADGEAWGRDASRGYVRAAVEKSLTDLGVDTIDLYQYHRPDRSMVYADTIESFRVLLDEGLVTAVGISNANVEEIEIALEVLGEGGLASVQNEFSPRHPGSYDELVFCGRHGIAFLPWSPLGGTGGGARDVGSRFGVFADIARDHDVSPQRAVLAWELSLGDHVIPIPGARRIASIEDSAQAADLDLSADELARASAALGIELQD
ncbi:aldo/keto reductase [Serinibacter arcticus]|uniref:Aldo/keto reductase n=1 Tax=Serinibacter arcticus TaxID=1655435 RepID=A0A2U1ZRJ4_9MICO|nr:aldo/keto reductase [Serinibacter arcticus]PWD49542.1 aldo/keto reductase [Serinibacter arcticus]